MSKHCRTHCCVLHGCKYGHDYCPVENGTEVQEYTCPQCESPKSCREQAAEMIRNAKRQEELEYKIKEAYPEKTEILYSDW